MRADTLIPVGIISLGLLFFSMQTTRSDSQDKYKEKYIDSKHKNDELQKRNEDLEYQIKRLKNKYK